LICPAGRFLDRPAKSLLTAAAAAPQMAAPAVPSLTSEVGKKSFGKKLADSLSLKSLAPPKEGAEEAAAAAANAALADAKAAVSGGAAKAEGAVGAAGDSLLDKAQDFLKSDNGKKVLAAVAAVAAAVAAVAATSKKEAAPPAKAAPKKKFF
jgi:hypothetical protein